MSYGISVSIKIYTSPFCRPWLKLLLKLHYQPDKFHYPASKPRRDISKAFKNCPSVVWGQHLVIGSREDNSNRSASSVSLLDEQCIIFSVHVGPGTRSA